MITVHIFAQRNLANDHLLPENRDKRSHPEQVVQLPFIPMPGDTYFPGSDWAGMTVKHRDATANNDEIAVIVEASSWSYHELERAGFNIYLGN